MMNIPINFNMSEFINNSVGKEPGLSLGAISDKPFEKVILNITEKSSLLNKKEFNNEEHVSSYTKDDIQATLSSFEDLLTNLIDNNEDVELNEDFSFLQNVIQFLVLSNEISQIDKGDNFDTDFFRINNLNSNISNKYSRIENSLNSYVYESIASHTEKPEGNFVDTIYLNTSNNANSILDSDYTKVFEEENFREIITTIKNSNNDTIGKSIKNILDSTTEAMSSNLDVNLTQSSLVSTIDKKITTDNYQGLNLSKDTNLILEFMSTLKENDVLAIENLDNNLKKDVLIDRFKEFLIENHKGININDIEMNKNKDINIDAFYNTFKTLSTADDTKAYKNIDSLDSNGLIDLLSNVNILRNNNTDSSFNASNDNNLLLRRDNISEDLQSSVLHMKNSNVKQLKLRLTPRELGEMLIDISQVENVSNIKLTISNDETLSLIHRNLNEIISSLKEANLISENSSVIVQSGNSQKEFSSSSNNLFNQHQHSSNNDKDKASLDVDSIENLDNTNAKIKSDSKLNILA